MTPKNQQRVEEIIRNIHYRKWELWVSPVTATRAEGTETNFFEIGARIETADADGSDYVYVRGFSQLLPEWVDIPTIVEAAYDLIDRLERHERREFFYFEGERILDPHRWPKKKKHGRKKKKAAPKYS
jgi:hypothetical protein